MSEIAMADPGQFPSRGDYEKFVRCCKLAGVVATHRQARKWADEQGEAFGARSRDNHEQRRQLPKEKKDRLHLEKIERARALRRRRGY